MAPRHIHFLVWCSAASAAAAAAAAAATAAAAAPSPAPDAPYEEILSTRRPFSGAWPPAQLPSGWRPLPCASLAPGAPAVAGGGVGALFLCGPGSEAQLFSASLDATLAASGDALPPPAALAASTLVAAASGAVFLLAPGGAALFALDCSAALLSCNVTALPLPAPLPGPIVSGATAYASVTAGGCVTVWAAGGSAVAAYDVDIAARRVAALPGLPFAFGATAVAYSAVLSEIALGNASKVVFIPAAAPGTISYWEWVTDIASGDGGVYDDAVTALAYDDASGGLLYVGSPTCLNVRTPSGVVSRIAAHEGLPWGNVSSLSLNLAGPRTRLWVGTSRGVLLYDPGAATQYGAGARAADALDGPPLSQRFRYFYGPRWLSSSSPAGAFDGSAVSGLVAVGATLFVAASGGLSALEARNMTLLDKVRVYETAVPRHSRLGQISGCNLLAFGVVEGCVNGADDNDGLWTSLTVIGESMRLLLTGDDEARALVAEHFQGMHLLMRATGIRGLIARSVVCPGCDTGGGGVWHNSSVPGLENFLWKGDASSDEVAGHSLAYPFVVAALSSSDPANASLARGALLDLARYIVSNGFVLIDVTGLPTHWGHFDPATLNHNRTSWCDSRGLNSVEVLGLIVGGLALTDAADPDHALFAQALVTLRDAGYFRNAVNLKIEAPSDDNYSDDELALFAYLAFVNSARGLPEVTAEDWRLMNLSLARTFGALRPERAAIWNSFFAIMGVDIGPIAAADALWNLRTWQYELVSWPTANSHRLDVIPDVTNAGRSGGGSNDALSVLPANERSQGRWNGDPYDLDGGDGMSEDDPGAFILSYWATRFAGLLDAPAA